MVEAPPSSEPFRASGIDRVVAVVLGVVVVWTTLGLGGYRPETMVVPSVVLGALLAMRLGWAAIHENRAGAPWTRVDLWPVPFLAYAAANVIWITPVPWLGRADWALWLLLAEAYWLARCTTHARDTRRTVLASVYGAALVSAALGCYQHWVDPSWLMLGRTQAEQFVGRAAGAFGIPNSQAALMVLLLPPALAHAAARGAGRVARCAAGLAAFGLLLGLVLTISRGAWLAMAVAGVAWAAAQPGRSWTQRLGLILGSGVAVAAVGLAAYATVPQVKERFDRMVAERGERTRPIMWRGAWALFLSSPAVGTGAGSYNVLFERHRPESFRDDPQWAHNDYLNTASDYGLVGVGLLAIGLGALAVQGRREGWGRNPQALAWLAGLGAFALALTVDFHLKIPALALTVGIALAQAIRPVPRTAASPVSFRALAGAGLGLVAVGHLAWVTPHYRSEALRYPARREIDALGNADGHAAEERKVRVAQGLDAFVRATAIDPHNAQAQSDLAYATSLAALDQPERAAYFAQVSEEAARRALAESKVVPEFWWRLGVALDMQGRWVEAGDAFAEAVRLAPASSLAWYHQAYHFNLKPATRALAGAAAATALRLNPDHRPARELLEALGRR